VSREKKLEMLREWRKAAVAVRDALDRLRVLTHAGPESPLYQAVIDQGDLLRKIAEEVLGDEEGWLGWYQMECDLGEKPMEVDLIGEDGKPGREVLVVTVEDLLEVMEH
jgi:hypothetical protein